MGTFFDKILKEFGIYYTQLAIVAPIIFVSYGLNDKIDSAAWVITMALTLCIVFAFKDIVSPNRLKSVLYTFLIILPLAAIEIFILTHEKYSLILTSKIAFTTYNSLIFTIFIGVFIISCKKQDLDMKKPYPDAISTAIISQLNRNRFYKTNIVYNIAMEDSRDGYIWLNVDYSYNVFNRCDDTTTWKIIIETYGKNYKNASFQIDNTPIDTDNNGRVVNNRGFEIETSIKPLSSARVISHFEIEYPINGSELFLTYDPATDLVIIINNLTSEADYAIETHHENHGNGIHPTKRNNHVEYEINTGLLPYEGFHLKWKKRSQIPKEEAK